MIFQGTVGQVSKVILAAQYLDSNGAPVTPTVPEARVYGGSPILLHATVTPTELPGVTGFMVGELDISNFALFPAGQYVVRWTGVTSGAETSIVAYLQIVPGSVLAGSSVVGGSYTTEERIRNVNKLLADVSAIPTFNVALEAQRAADWINGRLGARYTVPFTAPIDPLISVLNDWWAAANLLDWRYGENGNLSDHASALRRWVDGMLDRLIAGSETLIVPPIAGSTTGSGAASSYSKTWSGTMPNIRPSRGVDRR